jgi:hypothetical protein
MYAIFPGGAILFGGTIFVERQVCFSCWLKENVGFFIQVEAQVEE